MYDFIWIWISSFTFGTRGRTTESILPSPEWLCTLAETRMILLLFQYFSCNFFCNSAISWIVDVEIASESAVQCFFHEECILLDDSEAEGTIAMIFHRWFIHDSEWMNGVREDEVGGGVVDDWTGALHICLTSGYHLALPHTTVQSLDVDTRVPFPIAHLHQRQPLFLLHWHSTYHAELYFFCQFRLNQNEITLLLTFRCSDDVVFAHRVAWRANYDCPDDW